MSFPKVMAAGKHPDKASAATAVAAHEANGGSLFVGGKLTDSVWIDSHPGMAFVGKINVGTRMWSWQKRLYLDPQLTTVTALSVAPSGNALACYGTEW